MKDASGRLALDPLDHPYSEGFERDGVVFLSGVISVDQNRKAVAGRREAVDAALLNLERRLANFGLSLRNVLKLTFFLTDITLRDELNDLYSERFHAPRPTRTIIGVAALPQGASVAMDAVAHRRERGQGD